MSLLIKDEKLLEKYYEILKKSATLSKKNLTATLYTIKNIQKLKQNFIMEKSIQDFIVIKYQKKALYVFACKYFYSIQFIKRLKLLSSSVFRRM